MAEGSEEDGAEFDPFRLDLQHDRNADAVARLIPGQLNVGDLTDADATELHRRSRPKAAHRAVEVDQEGELAGIPGRLDATLVVEQGVCRSFFRRLAGILDARRVEGDSSGCQGLEGFDRERRTVGTIRKLDAAGVPEPAVRPHQLVIGGMDEHRDVEFAPVLREFVAENLAHLDAGIKDRHARRQAAEAVGGQQEPAAGRVGLDQGRVLKTLEAGFRFAGAWVDADIRAGDDRGQPGNPAGSQPGLHDPEAASVGQVFGGLLDHPGGHLDMAEIVGDGHALDRADIDRLVLDLGLAGLDPLGGFEGYRHQGTLVACRTPDQPAAGKRRHQRHDPYEGQGVPLTHGLRRRGDRCIIPVPVIQGLSSPVGCRRHPTSAVDRRHVTPAW